MLQKLKCLLGKHSYGQRTENVSRLFKNRETNEPITIGTKVCKFCNKKKLDSNF